ncbi:MAG: Glu/Leu/Phe/Val family dehydrogenase [Candidatus Rhabdochlamydia sp.]
MAQACKETLTLEEISVPGYEKVIRVLNPEAGLHAIICIHSSVIGPTLGGIRIHPYSNEEAALKDVLRLAKAMTYKSLLSECSWGGAKAVIIADPKTDKTKELLSAFAEAVDQLKGEYICAEDVGCSPEDVLVISKVTPYVVGLPHKKSSGNPASFTAWGTFRGIQSALKKVHNSSDLEGRKVAIQGIGSVGFELAKLLFWAGAHLIISDLDQKRCLELQQLTGAVILSTEEILKAECDVLAPCAMGGILNSRTIPLLRCLAIAGCANNQLLNDDDADELANRGILYAPDFIINAGGLINVSLELEPEGYDPIQARNRVNRIYDYLMVVYDIAEKNRSSTHRAALSLGEYRLNYKIGKRREPPCFHHASLN